MKKISKKHSQDKNVFRAQIALGVGSGIGFIGWLLSFFGNLHFYFHYQCTYTPSINSCTGDSSLMHRSHTVIVGDILLWTGLLILAGAGIFFLIREVQKEDSK